MNGTVFSLARKGFPWRVDFMQTWCSLMGCTGGRKDPDEGRGIQGDIYRREKRAKEWGECNVPVLFLITELSAASSPPSPW